MLNKLTIICGPTAVGKTSLGVELCKKYNGEIISADSQQVYRGMDIGTAKEDLTGQGIKCHLVDIINPDELFDASKFKELADKAINDVVSRGKLPVVVGGTGLYIKALLEGLCEAPERDKGIRDKLETLRHQKGQEALFEILKKEDPVMAKKLHINDTSRVIRAIEVKRLSGRGISEFQTEQKAAKNYDAKKIGLTMDRAQLYEKINMRVDQMIAKGLLKEVKGLVEKYGTDIQALKAVGYKEIVNHLKGKITLEEAIDLTKRDTRRFAKRQLTWFKSDKEIEWFTPDQIEKGDIIAQ